ncbi:MAG: hypothetical protein KAT65_17905 [Methanophagales archaeon]|nr:hypothetical protein [Methanophagales archaeon]
MPNRMGIPQDTHEICINQSDTPSPPQPTYDVVRFLSWLKKRGAIHDLKKCVKKWEREGINIEKSIKNLGVSFIKIYRRSGGEKVVFLENKVWADQWMVYYDLEIPHHKQMQKTQK